MKFFSELGSCYRPSTSAVPSNKEEDGAIQMVAPLPSSRRHHLEHKNKLGGSGGSSASSAARHWRPSLQAIREDVIGLNAEGKIKITEKSAYSENKSKGRYTSKPHRVSHKDDSYSRKNNSEPMIIPAFSPTPFMF